MSSAQKPPLVGIVGPTASGKTELSIDLAQEFHGEIVSADSRQVYRGLDVGAAKVTPEQQRAVPHHMIDVADPKETHTVAQYKDGAVRAIEHIHQRGKVPFLVGGTGLYVRAVVDNLRIPPVAPQPELRAELERLELPKLQERLKEVDPVGYELIDLQNPRRVIRAIEVSETAGVPFSKLTAADEPLFDSLVLGLHRELDVLRERIAERHRGRWPDLVAEVRALHEGGLDWDRLESFGLTYRRAAEFVRGERDETDTIELIIKEEAEYAKRQMTWFRKEERIRWISDQDDAQELISDWLVNRTEHLA